MTTPSRPTTSLSEGAAPAADDVRLPGWLARRELACAAGPAARLQVVMREACLFAAHVAVLRARRPGLLGAPPAAGPPQRRAAAVHPPVALCGWAALGPGEPRDLRAWSRSVAGDAAIATASRHLCPWLGPPTAGDVALLAELGRPAPACLMVAAAALGAGHALVVVADGPVAPSAAAWQAWVALVQRSATGVAPQRAAAAPPAGGPVSWAEVAAAAEQAARWAAAG